MMFKGSKFIIASFCLNIKIGQYNFLQKEYVW